MNALKKFVAALDAMGIHEDSTEGEPSRTVVAGKGRVLQHVYLEIPSEQDDQETTVCFEFGGSGEFYGIEVRHEDVE